MLDQREMQGYQLVASGGPGGMVFGASLKLGEQ
jgi:hypothetical protein